MSIPISKPLRLCALVLVLSAPCHPARALDDGQIVQSLEALGEFEAAWPLALKLAKERDDYQGWRDLFTKYRAQDPDPLAYRAAWARAVTLDSEPVYRDFLTLDPGHADNAVAVHAIFKLRQGLDTIEGYRGFMADFPNSVEAVQALLRIHEIAWERAREDDRPAVFDAFVGTFPGARQIPQAIEAAYQAQRREVEQEIQADVLGVKVPYFSDEKRDRVARQLFNQARVAEKAGDTLAADRAYRLLELDSFRDTRAYTELLDRAERHAWQAHLTQQQARVEAATGRLQSALVEALGSQTRRLEDAIAEHTRRMDARIRSVRDDMQQGLNAAADALHRNRAETDRRFAQVYGDMNSGFSQVGGALREQAWAMQQAAADASREQERLFRRGQEEAHYQQRLNRKCAEELARNGKYRFLSSCK
jgi:hypothetical protein